MNKKFSVLINNKIKKFNKTISIESDKSISHRALLIASQCIGPSILKNILESEDVKNTIVCLKKLGVKILKKNKTYIVYVNGLGSLQQPKKNKLYVGNSGTLARMICGLLSTNPNLKIKIFGDKSMNKRDMLRVIEPLQKIGCFFYPAGKTTLPLTIESTSMPLAQHHNEIVGSAQIKTAILLASLNIPGITTIEQKKISRDHTENILSIVKAGIKIKKLKKGNLVSLRGQKNLSNFDLKIPGDLSSAAPFIALTLLTPGAKLLIENINCNPTRLGFVNIIKKMNAKIKLINVKIINSEKTGDIVIKSSNLKSIICSSSIVPFAIDEFILCFLLAAKAKGVSIFKGLGELNKKESPRLNVINKILNQIGIKTRLNKKIGSIKIYGNPNIDLNKFYKIETYYDHRICMAAFVMALSFGGKIKIKDCDSIATSFPKFLTTIKKIGGKYEIKK